LRARVMAVLLLALPPGSVIPPDVVGGREKSEAR